MKWWYWMLTYYWFHIPKYKSLIWSFSVSRPGKFWRWRIVCESLWRLTTWRRAVFVTKNSWATYSHHDGQEILKAWNNIAESCTVKKSLVTLFRITVLWQFGHVLEPSVVGVVCKWKHKWVQIKFVNSNMLLLKLKIKLKMLNVWLVFNVINIKWVICFFTMTRIKLAKSCLRGLFVCFLYFLS